VPDRRHSLNVLDVPNPCTVPWRSMTGSQQVRFCTQCRKNVYNLSAMTADEADAVLITESGTPCVRFYRRADRTVVTADRCGNRVSRSWRRFTAMLTAVLVGLASLAGCDCSRLGFCTQGKLAAPPGVAPMPPPSNDDTGEDDEP
jgi:hypothetical protein